MTEVSVDGQATPAPPEPDHERSETSDPTPAGETHRVSPRFVLAIERYALLWLTIAIAIFFAVDPSTSDTFTSVANIRNIVGNESVTAILAMAAMLPLVAFQFDISIGAVMGATSILIAKLTAESGWPLGGAIAAGIVFGIMIGLINGYLIAYVGTSAFITTLGMATLLTGLVSLYSANQTIVNIPQSLINFGNGNWLGIPRPTYLVVVVAAVVGYFLRYTVTGRQLLYIGSNPSSARLVGVPVARRIMQAIVFGAVIAAIAGVVQLARDGSGNPQIGLGTTLNAITAVFLGSTTIRPGFFNVRGTFVGVFFVAISVNGLTLLGASDWVTSVFNGAAVILAITVATVLAKRRGLRATVF